MLAKISRNILRPPAAQTFTGISHAGMYAKAKSGHMPKPVRVGPNASGWVEYELEAVNTGKIAGLNDEAIKGLVQKLHAVRTESDDVIRQVVRDHIAGNAAGDDRAAA